METEDVYSGNNVPLGLVRVIAGGLLIGLGIVFVALQLRLIYIIMVFKDFRSSLTYFIIVVSSLTELPQNVSHCFSGFCVFWQTETMFITYKIVGSFCESFFFATLCVNFALALNRLDAFKPSWVPNSYHFKRIHACGIFAVGGFVALVFIVFSFTSKLFVTFDFVSIAIRYGGPYHEYCLAFLFWGSCGLISITLFCYFIIFVVIVVRRKKNSTRRNHVSASEVKLLISAAFQFLAVLISVVSLSFQQVVPPFLVYCNALLLSGVQPIIHVCVNRKLRRRYFKRVLSTSSMQACNSIHLVVFARRITTPKIVSEPKTHPICPKDTSHTWYCVE